MNNNKKLYSTLIGLCLSSVVNGAPIGDFQFKSPSFNGSGYSSHVLTIENQESTRKQQVQKDVQAALEKAASAKNNTNIAKFMNNLESRIYAQISQNLATSMFANSNCATGATGCSGTLNFEGNVIFWTKDGGNITLQVTDTVGNTTTVVVPLGQFQFGT